MIRVVCPKKLTKIGKNKNIRSIIYSGVNLSITHEFEASRNDDLVDINGVFEVNIWYSTEENAMMYQAK